MAGGMCTALGVRERNSYSKKVTISLKAFAVPKVVSIFFIALKQTTTTLRSKCTDGFTGTRASTPLVSGVSALALQAK